MSKYNWEEIQQFYNEGNSFRALTKQFGVPNETINKAVRSGDFISRNKKEAAQHVTRKQRTQRTKRLGVSKSYRNVKQWRFNTKVKLMAGFGNKCGICDVVDHPCTYDFHHLDAGNKDFTISAKIRSWESLSTEARKCVLLCAPCHRKYHHGVLDIPDDIQRFDEELVRTQGIEP